MYRCSRKATQQYRVLLYYPGIGYRVLEYCVSIVQLTAVPESPRGDCAPRAAVRGRRIERKTLRKIVNSYCTPYSCTSTAGASCTLFRPTKQLQRDPMADCMIVSKPVQFTFDHCKDGPLGISFRSVTFNHQDHSGVCVGAIAAGEPGPWL